MGGHWNLTKGPKERRIKEGKGFCASRMFIEDVKYRDSHHIPLGSHQSCLHSRPHRHTSSRGVYKECCYTGIRLGGSVYPLKHPNVYRCSTLTVVSDGTLSIIVETYITVFAHRHCHISPHHCRPCSLDLHHSASGWECNGHFCTGTDHCHTSHHSHSEPKHSMPFISTPGMSDFEGES